MNEEIRDIEFIPKVEKVKAIIPCCGFGTRMGMQSHESKELLPDSDGRPLIQKHIDLCIKYNLEPIFLIRPEKLGLIEYVKDLGTVVLYSPKENEDWAHTIYANREHFGTKNVLLLPDTTFEPEKMKEILEHLEWLEIVVATHEVPDYETSKWGIYDGKTIYEKSKDTTCTKAWGIIGFDLSVVHIFRDLGKNKRFDLDRLTRHEIKLDKFEDLTRNGKA